MCDFCLFICLENKAMRESKLRYMFEKFHFVLSESFVIATWLKRPLTESHFGLLREMVSSEKKKLFRLEQTCSVVRSTWRLLLRNSCVCLCALTSHIELELVV